MLAEPVYMPQEQSLFRELGYKRQPGRYFLEYNAHTPTSVLITLPFGLLQYTDAFVIWNILSLAALAAALALIAWELELRPSLWTALPIVTVLLVCRPVHANFFLGQWNAVLLLLITAAWVMDRRDRSVLAGVFAGTAAVIKVFPGLLILYFLLRRNWNGVSGWFAAVTGWTIVTVLVLGPDTFRDYVTVVMPSLSSWQPAAGNISLLGFWSKLLGHPATPNRIPILNIPQFAPVATAACDLIVIGFFSVSVLRARTQRDRDYMFGTCVSAAVLLSPIAWDHYFLLLTPILARLWVDLPPGSPSRWAFRIILLLIWIPLGFWRSLLIGANLDNIADNLQSITIVRPWQSLTALSFQTYALVGLLVLGLRAATAERLAPPESIPSMNDMG
ncbi:MAG: DUF2029 domain-containing protein [Planctomycetes bacterium]|nr:DUF2029 domain-containing protein [Planctomycetota bacterium]